jgi:PTS system nitrogen regulatory IIA component
MTIGDLITPDRVIVGLRAANKLALLQDLAGCAAAATALETPVTFNALQARENFGSTGLGKGFALPHARLQALKSPYALFVRLARPIDFAAIDERPVDLAVLLLTPDGGSEHLAMLAAVSRPMRGETFIRRLRQAADAAALHAVLASA